MNSFKQLYNDLTSRANAVQCVSKPTKTIIDNRPQAIAQRQIQLTAQSHSSCVAQLVKEKPFIITKGQKFKKKKKQRKEAVFVEETLDNQIERYVHEYGHSIERHSSLTQQQLDARNKPIATTFDTHKDIMDAAKHLIINNAAKLNNWYENTETERIVIWAYLPEGCNVRGRQKATRPDWHHKVGVMPARPGSIDVDDNLNYVIGVFDRQYWASINHPKGLMTCYPSESKPQGV